jgi:CRP-like cAMP-binding protein
MTEVLEIAAGKALFHEGDPADVAYFLVSGKVEVSVQHDGARKVLAVLEANSLVGEMGLIDPAPRMATAIALERTCYRVITASVMSKLCAAAPTLSVHILRSLIRTARLRAGLPAFLSDEAGDRVDRIDDVFLDRRSYRKGETIFEQGDPSKGLYLIQDGEIDIRRIGSNHSLRVYRPGEAFGERGPLDNSPRAASAIALTRATCVFISSERFNEALRSTPPILVGLMRIYIKAY